MGSPDVESEKVQHSDELSRVSNSPNVEKPKGEVENVRPVEVPDESSTEYPSGMRLVITVVSLMLSTFLIALDNVSQSGLLK